jgi:hypothetical protein
MNAEDQSSIPAVFRYTFTITWTSFHHGLLPTMLCYAIVLVLSSIDVLAAQIHPSTGPAFKDEYIVYASPSYFP